MNLYKHHTERELVAVLDDSAKLTYEAQKNLLREIKRRSLEVSTNTLEEQITAKVEMIENLEHLGDLGFVYQKNDLTGEITLRRTTGAKIMDVVSTVIGTLMFGLGLVYFWLLLAIFFGDNEFTMTKLFTYVLVITGGLIGLKMLSGINRFLDYNTFSLVQSGSAIRLKKGGIPEEQIFTTDELRLNEEDGELILSAGNIEIMRSAEDNLVYKHTLEALLQKMTAN